MKNDPIKVCIKTDTGELCSGELCYFYKECHRKGSAK